MDQDAAHHQLFGEGIEHHEEDRRDVILSERLRGQMRRLPRTAASRIVRIRPASRSQQRVPDHQGKETDFAGEDRFHPAIGMVHADGGGIPGPTCQVVREHRDQHELADAEADHA